MYSVYTMTRTVCLIPARGGSKRIPNKNIRDFFGKPVISYSIEAARKTQIFDEIVVSTDSAQISNVSLSLGAKVPFLRNHELSDDDIPTLPVIRDAIAKLGLADIDFLCCLYPVAPLIQTKNLITAHVMARTNPERLVTGVVEYRYPTQRALRQSQNGTFSMIVPENLEKRSQELEPTYHDAGQFYFGRVSTWLTVNSILHETLGLLISSWASQDIDNESDWKYAEYLYQVLRELNSKISI